MQLKENQPSLCNTIEQIIYSRPTEDIYEEVEKSHGRVETRVVESYSLSGLLKNGSGWDKYLNGCALVRRIFETYDNKEKKWNLSEETSLYVSSVAKSSQEFASIIRNHWSTENSNHYVKDVTLNEDDSRIRKNPSIFAILRSFALNVMRANKVNNVRTELFKNCCNFASLLQYKYLF